MRVSLIVLALFVCAVAHVAALHRLPTRLKKVGIPGPGCPPRPKIPSNPPMLPQFFVDYIAETVSNLTLSACNLDPLAPGKPSATALSMAIVVGPHGSQDQPDHTAFRNFGCRDKSKPASGDNMVTEDTIYRLASVSKTFTVEMVLNAVMSGRIRSWDDPIDQYFADIFIDNPYGDGAQPTFKHICSQLAGLPRSSPCGSPCHYTSEEMVARIAKYVEMIHPANMIPSYSNLGYSILGNLVSERLYGAAYATHLFDSVTGPLGLNSTGVKYSDDVKARMAVEYGGDGNVAPWVTLGWDDPSGGLFSSARDMAEWTRHFFADWAESPWRRETMQPVYMNGDGLSGFGAPWEFTSSHGYLVRCKSGDLPGVTTIIAIVPELSLGMVFLWNGENIDTMDIAQVAVDAAIPFMVSAYQSANIREFPAVDESFCGTFCNQTYVAMVGGAPLSATVSTQTNASLSDVPFVVIDFVGMGSYMLKPDVPTVKTAKRLGVGPYDFAFQITVPRVPSQQCMWPEFLAENGEWVFFSHDAATRRPQFMCPGLQPDTVFIKQK